MGYARGAAAIGAILGLLFGNMLAKTGWGVIIGVAIGFIVGTAIDRVRSKK